MDAMFLSGFTVIRPEPGLLFWTIVIFVTFWLTVGRGIIRMIANMMKEREEGIQRSLDEAKRVREEMQQLQAQNEDLLAQAQEERTQILAQAKAAKDSIISEAREQAKEEARRIISTAKEQIENMKTGAIIDLKNQVGAIALEVAAKVLEKDLASDAEQVELVEKLVSEMELN